MTTSSGLAPFAYGFGWVIDRERGHRAVFHSGGTPGFSSALRYATDVYIHSDPKVFPKRLTQGTVLHEALHNLTGLFDPELADLLDVDKSKYDANGSIEITPKLVEVGCAGKQ